HQPSTRHTTLEIGGAANLTFNQLARAIQDAARRPGTPRHVPPQLLRVVANTVGRVNPTIGRQTRAALVMDDTDFTFNATDVHQAYPDIPCTPFSQVLAQLGSPDRGRRR
ncbi:MAG TPA: hypothetical protein VGA62_05225, partial [Acidimicrobiia bacterium]